MVRVDGGVAMAAKLAKEGIFVEVHVSVEPVIPGFDTTATGELLTQAWVDPAT